MSPSGRKQSTTKVLYLVIGIDLSMQHAPSMGQCIIQALQEAAVVMTG